MGKKIPVAAGMKWCTGYSTCDMPGHETSIEDFGPNKSKHDGLQATCRLCVRARHRWYRDNPVEPPAEQKCGNCKLVYTADNFYLDPFSHTGLHSSCIKCKTGYTKDWHTNNPEKSKALTRKRRARQKNAYHEPWDNWTQYHAFGGICHICLKHVGFKECEMDHIIPLDRGGDDAPHNIAPAHKRCNCIKRTRTMKELKDRGVLKRLRT